MKAGVILLVAALCGCMHRVTPRSTGQDRVDVFRIACSSATNCTSNSPRTSFPASTAPAGVILVTRNGVILAESIDYTTSSDSLGMVTVTFTSQPVTDGDIIQLRYLAAAW